MPSITPLKGGKLFKIVYDRFTYYVFAGCDHCAKRILLNLGLRKSILSEAKIEIVSDILILHQDYLDRISFGTAGPLIRNGLYEVKLKNQENSEKSIYVFADSDANLENALVCAGYLKYDNIPSNKKFSQNYVSTSIYVSQDCLDLLTKKD